LTATESPRATQDGQAPRRLLIVDDNLDILKMVRRMAEQLGMSVDTAAGGREALSAAGATQPDVIMLDLSMPEMDGIELLRKLAAQGCTASIVLMTGFDSFYMEAARKIGEVTGLKVAGTLNKPLRIAELKALLGDAPGAGQEP